MLIYISWDLRNENKLGFLPSPSQPQLPFYQLIMIAITISAAPGGLPCVSQEVCELRAGARVRAGSHPCAEGEIPFHFMLGWHFVRRPRLPPRSLCAAAGAEV